MPSLHTRLLIAATLLMIGFLGATGVALDEAFRGSAEAALRDRLLAEIYALLAAADTDAEGRMVMPRTPPDPRFSNPDSGLYAAVQGQTGDFRWYSPSLTGRPRGFLIPLAPGQRRFQRLGGRRRNGLYVLNFGIAWEDNAGEEQNYSFAVAEDIGPFLDQIEAFRGRLWTWLGGMGITLLLAQGLILRWGLRPLRRVATDLNRIESGETHRLAGTYPRELRGLTGNLNALIARIQANQQRYRHSLDDLAHSLKTPLAILRNASDADLDADELAKTLDEQVRRMDDIVQHQLRRAAATGRSALSPAIEAGAVLERLLRSLKKVYHDKPMAVSTTIAAGSRFFGDEADLLEMLGNILDNAFKYGRSQVQIDSEPLPEAFTARPGLRLRIEDDGPGIAPAQARRVLQRGQRLDQDHPGQGIGLAVARELVALYQGRLEIDRGSLGGARFTLVFPAG